MMYSSESIRTSWPPPSSMNLPDGQREPLEVLRADRLVAHRVGQPETGTSSRLEAFLRFFGYVLETIIPRMPRASGDEQRVCDVRPFLLDKISDRWFQAVHAAARSVTGRLFGGFLWSDGEAPRFFGLLGHLVRPSTASLALSLSPMLAESPHSCRRILEGGMDAEGRLVVISPDIH